MKPYKTVKSKLSFKVKGVKVKVSGDNLEEYKDRLKFTMNTIRREYDKLNRIK